MNYSLNQLILRLKELAEDHNQINTNGFGELWEIGVDAAPIYPLFWSNVVSSNLSSKQLSISLQLLTLDLVHKDLSNENEVLSDMLQVMTDLVSELRREDSFLLENNVSFTPVREKFDDEVGGWIANINIQIPYSYNICAIPNK
jgi:hypothetical protein